MDVMVVYWAVCLTIKSNNKGNWRCVLGSFDDAGSGYGIFGLGDFLCANMNSLIIKSWGGLLVDLGEWERIC